MQIVAWKQIANLPYEVSDTGLVRNMRTEHVLCPILQGRKRRQYRVVSLSFFGKVINRKICQLVLETFVSPRPLGLVVRHLDDNQFDDRLTNLQWGTRAQNAQDRRTNNPYRLTSQKAAEILHRRRAGEKGVSLAHEFQVSQATICDIFKGRIHWEATV